jgi:hypothetical protein
VHGRPIAGLIAILQNPHAIVFHHDSVEMWVRERGILFHDASYLVTVGGAAVS